MAATTAPAAVPPKEIIATATVRLMAGKHLARPGRAHKPVTRHTLLRWRELHEFPEPIRKTDGIELWDRRQVRAWLREKYPAVD